MQTLKKQFHLAQQQSMHILYRAQSHQSKKNEKVRFLGVFFESKVEKVRFLGVFF